MGLPGFTDNTGGRVAFEFECMLFILSLPNLQSCVPCVYIGSSTTDYIFYKMRLSSMTVGICCTQKSSAIVSEV